MFKKRWFSNVIESDEGFSVRLKLKGFVGDIVYIEGNKTLTIPVEIGADNSLNIFPSDLKQWDSPYDSSPLTLTEKQRIYHNLKRALAYIKIPVTNVTRMSRDEVITAFKSPLSGRLPYVIQSGQWIRILIYPYVLRYTDGDRQLRFSIKQSLTRDGKRIVKMTSRIEDWETPTGQEPVGAETQDRILHDIQEALRERGYQFEF